MPLPLRTDLRFSQHWLKQIAHRSKSYLYSHCGIVLDCIRWLHVLTSECLSLWGNITGLHFSTSVISLLTVGSNIIFDISSQISSLVQKTDQVPNYVSEKRSKYTGTNVTNWITHKSAVDLFKYSRVGSNIIYDNLDLIRISFKNLVKSWIPYPKISRNILIQIQHLE